MMKFFDVRKTETHICFDIFSLKLNFRKKFKCKQEVIELKEKVQKMESQIEILKYFIDSSCDITKCRKATGVVRNVQMMRFKALKLVTTIFERHNLTYWLEYGTLIGAYRHKGFIPWDDDVDISMDRKSYLKAAEILKEYFKGSNLRVSFCVREMGALLRVLYKNTVLIDIFPYDYSDNLHQTCDELTTKWVQIREEFYNNYKANDFWNKKYHIYDTYDLMYNLYADSGLQTNFNISDGKWMFRGLETCAVHFEPSFHLKENIFPLKKVNFEDIQVYAPANIENYLKEVDRGIYGDIMQFPSLDYVFAMHIPDECQDENYIKEVNLTLDKYIANINNEQ